MLWRLTILFPSTASIGNAILIFITFLIAVPGIIIPTTRGWLKLHGFMVVVCAMFTLVIGLDIWFETLKTRDNLSQIWNQQPSSVQSLLQQEVRPPPFFPKGTSVLTMLIHSSNAADT